MSAVPVADPNYQQERIPLKGEIPNPANPPSGCYFHTRCRYCDKKCMEQTPDYREFEQGHFAACLLADDLKLKGFDYSEMNA
jgi:peptide/nickel transport system ATP-binding protein